MKVADDDGLAEAITALRADLQRAIDRALAREAISDRQVLVLYLHYVSEFSTDEIAGMMGVKRATVRRDMQRALRAIRDTGYLEGYLEEETTRASGTEQ